MRTNAIVVDSSRPPEPPSASLNLSIDGAAMCTFTGVRFGRYPPRAWRRACMYCISGVSSDGFRNSHFIACSSVIGTLNRFRT